MGYLFGGEKNKYSGGTYYAIYKALREKGIPVGGVHNSVGLWVDEHGELYSYESEVATSAKDGTLPIPKPLDTWPPEPNFAAPTPPGE